MTPERLLQACEDVDLLFDTAEQNGSKDRDCPTGPALRCVAVTDEAAEAVANRINSSAAPARSG